MEVLYKTTMEMYESYFTMLEIAMQKTPTTDVEGINELNALIEEGNEALQADMAVFDKAISMDAEGLAGLQDELRIAEIYNKLKK